MVDFQSGGEVPNAFAVAVVVGNDDDLPFRQAQQEATSGLSRWDTYSMTPLDELDTQAVDVPLDPAYHRQEEVRYHAECGDGRREGARGSSQVNVSICGSW